MKGFHYQMTLHIKKGRTFHKISLYIISNVETWSEQMYNKDQRESQKHLCYKQISYTGFQYGQEQSKKKTYIVVLLNVQGQSKLAGVVNFEINECMKSEGECVLNLDRSPDSNAKIFFMYQIVNFGEINFTESRVNESRNQTALED